MAQAPGVRAEKRLATDRDSFNLITSSSGVFAAVSSCAWIEAYSLSSSVPCRATRSVSDAEDTESADALRHVFTRWQNNSGDALALTDNNSQLAAIKPVVQQGVTLSR
jgi:hypothetical protein